MANWQATRSGYMCCVFQQQCGQYFLLRYKRRWGLGWEEMCVWVTTAAVPTASIKGCLMLPDPPATLSMERELWTDSSSSWWIFPEISGLCPSMLSVKICNPFGLSKRGLTWRRKVLRKLLLESEKILNCSITTSIGKPSFSSLPLNSERLSSARAGSSSISL